jgi:hypothetical protein
MPALAAVYVDNANRAGIALAGGSSGTTVGAARNERSV